VKPAPKADRPETPRQAQWWEIRKNQYLNWNLCFVCACQAAWGHQIGFLRVKAPCSDCARIVAGFPLSASAGWRTLPQGSFPDKSGVD
jgi:hypothetical protein